MVDLSLDGDHWPFEGKVVQFKLDLELSALEWSGLGAEDEDAPERIVSLDDLVSPTWQDGYSFSNSWISLFNLGSISDMLIINIKSIYLQLITP